jgi:hypothetical protein
MMGPDPIELPVVGGGNGSVDELREFLLDQSQTVLFGVLRMGFGEGRLRRTKHIFIQANGTDMSAVKRGKFSAAKPQMDKAIGAQVSCSVSIELNAPQDLLLENIIERVRKAAVVDDEVLEGDKAPKSAFTVEAFREALKEEQKEIAKSAPPDSQGVCKRKTPGAGMEVTKAVSLVHQPDGPLNWALFGPSEEAISGARSRGIRMNSPRPSAGGCPQVSGGFMAAAARNAGSQPGPNAKGPDLDSRKSLTVPGQTHTLTRVSSAPPRPRTGEEDDGLAARAPSPTRSDDGVLVCEMVGPQFDKLH